MARVHIVSRFLLSYFCLIAIFGCAPYDHTGPVSKALKREVRVNGARMVNLADLTSFKWDELFLFGPYMPSSEICKGFSIAESECKTRIPIQSTDDGDMVMIFRNQGQIVHVEMHHRYNGDFTPFAFSQPVVPTNARFVVVPDGASTAGDPWLRLRHQPA